MKNQELNITDLIPQQTIQTFQNAFSDLTGFAAITTNAQGIPVSKPSKFTDFCKMCRSTEKGRKLCERCDITGAQATLEEGTSAYYHCHAGLVDFSAPILAGGTIVGSFSSGQVLLEPPNEVLIRHEAEQIGVNPDEYYLAAKKIRILDQSLVTKTSDYLSSIASIFSDMAYGKYLAIQANEEIEKAAKTKTDFLANMSHEIRTPMNAVIGMAELALRENLSDTAKDYINQIKSSGKALLAIINDILDFSKIESGKMNIIEEEYEPMSLINDVGNIIITRLQNKDVELILNIDPGLPQTLMGDSIRIRQILINLLNNATKFTQVGQVKLNVSFVDSPHTQDEILMNVSVEDTGIGIKKKDLEKIFTSFEQVDSKRNRNVEGTGLGLTICRNLLHLMNGKIWVESEYGIGSKFYFSVPQKVKNKNPSVDITKKKDVAVVGLFENIYLKEQLKKDMESLKVPYCMLRSQETLENDIKTLHSKVPGKTLYLLIDHKMFTPTVQNVIRKLPEVQSVLITDFFDQTKYEIANLQIIKKPISVLSAAIIINLEEDNHFLKYANKDSGEDYGFIAPEAKILVVDDNIINLSVTQGLLDPLEMKIETAVSGRIAMDKCIKNNYDIIFMDHMMPEMDGIETTKLIRRQLPRYNNIPIIALTANAVGDVKEMFLKEGLNDFVAKPIELRTIISKVKQWLPPEKIQKSTTRKIEKKTTENIVIGDLDTKTAISLLGSEALFWKILKEYYRVISKKIDKIKEYESTEDIKSYTIEVHALKSASRQIGATSLSEKAAFLEQAGNKNDIETIHAKTDEMLEQYDSYITVLSPFCDTDEEEENDGKEHITIENLQIQLDKIKNGAENLDQDSMEEALNELSKYSHPDKESELFKRIKDAIENIDVDACSQTVDDWIQYRANLEAAD